jgi:small GTP-binding protein
VISLNKKVCLLGDFAVGKTSVVRRFIYNLFDDKYLSTIGVKVSRKVLAVPFDSQVAELTLLLWDLAGGEEFNTVRASYLRGAAGGILVCDLTRAPTLDSLSGYVQELHRASPGARVIIAANKADLAGPQSVAQAQVADAAAHIGAPYYLTSARTGDSVEDLFRHLGRLLIG